MKNTASLRVHIVGIIFSFGAFGCSIPPESSENISDATDTCSSLKNEEECLNEGCYPIKGIKGIGSCLISDYVGCRSNSNCLNLLVPTQSSDKTCWLINAGCFPEGWPSNSEERVEECAYLEDLEACDSQIQ